MCHAGQQQTIGTSDPKAAEQATVTSTGGLDQDQITGDTISQIVGVRIATPFFGTGFNFCVGMAHSAPCHSLCLGCHGQSLQQAGHGSVCLISLCLLGVAFPGGKGVAIAPCTQS